MREIDITGLKFGTLTAVGRAGRLPSGGILWKFLCDCGNERFAVKTKVTKKQDAACEECSIKVRADKRITHGRTRRGSRDKLHSVWCKIKDRCFNPNTQSYPIYQGLDIKMEESWVNDFSLFAEHMGDPPDQSGKWSVDRIDNTRGYVEGNLRWATYSQQARNKGMPRNNTSGVVGVSFSSEGNGRWVAGYRDIKGKVRHKYFSIYKYGEEFAFLAACMYREHQIDLLNLQGAGYSENYGKAGYNAKGME